MNLIAVSTLTFWCSSVAIQAKHDGNHNKYTKDANNYEAKSNRKNDRDQKTDEKLFRINLLNQIYAKAAQRVDAKRLYDDFKMFDRELYEAKQERDNKDPEGHLYLAVEKKLRLLLRGLDLEDIMDQLTNAYKKHENPMDDLHDRKHKNREKVHFDPMLVKYSDSKVQAIWRDAIESGFSVEELKDLQEELTHYEIKMNEFKQKSTDLNSIHENSVKHEAKAEEFDRINAELKESHRELREQMDGLKDKVASTGGFKHERARKLWQRAEKSGKFNAKELEGIKEELVHFDRKLDKLKYFKNESSKHKEASKHHGKEHESEHGEFASKKVKELHTKTEKLERYLDEKITHTEL